MRQKTVAIIHYNTPELTMAAIMSLRKHGGRGYRIVLFDNSDKYPFEPMNGVEIIDNTKGQVIDFDAELAKFPDKVASIGCAKGCNYGSTRHILTVQKLWELIPEGFVLMESDVLIKRPIDEFFREEYSVVGYCQKAQPHNPFGIGRIMPMLCWMNVPMLTKEDAKYFDPTRTYGLLTGGRANRNNWYDTGAVLLEDILTKRPRLKGLHMDIRLFLEHYGSGSWKGNNINQQAVWLEQHRHLWHIDKPKVAICAIGRMENRYAVEWVEHYNALGVDKIFIYDNNRIEDGELFQDVLYPYIEAGFVEIIPWTGYQNPAYTDCYKRFGNEYGWIGFLDFDEYVMFDNKDMTLPEFLKNTWGDQLLLNWRIMTDNGLVHYDPRPLQERFTEGKGEDFPINHHVKCFIRGGLDGVLFLDPHSAVQPEMVCVNAEGRQVEQKSLVSIVTHHPARVDHFNTKTAEEWATLKMKRLFPIAGDYNANALKNNIEYFFSINERTAEKDKILGVVPPPTFDEAQGTPVVVISKPKTQKRKVSKKQK